jgi:signal transduction histidine kinase
MPVLYEIALLATVGAVVWIALDVGLDPARRRRFGCVLVLALSAFAWTSGELLLHQAGSPGAIAAARRFLFAGVCTFPAAWVWTSWVAARPQQAARAHWTFLALWVPSLVAYFAPGNLFLDWSAMPAQRGAFFYANAGYSWILISAGAFLVLRAMREAPTRSPAQFALVLAAALVPLVANAAHVSFHSTPWDPTPVALGFSALIFRFVVVDITWGAYYAPAARTEVVAQMRAGVLVADLGGRIVDWNRAAMEMLRVEQPDGRSLRQLLDDAHARRGREIEVYEFPLERRGSLFGTGAVLTDRAAMRHAELRLEMTTRVEALGYLAAGVAHEINNPLSYVSVNLTLLDRLVAALAADDVRKGLPDPIQALLDEAEELLVDAREGTERIQRIVERMTQTAGLDAASQSAGLIDVRFTVEKAVALASFGKRHRDTRVTAQGELPSVYAAETDVIHVVLHLLHNAVQMGGDDVPIAIELRGSEGGVAVRVEDEGPGIAESDLPHIFEPLFTTRRPGASMGLGLSLCWELARRNGGRLDAENRPNGGAAFTLWLPAASA